MQPYLSYKICNRIFRKWGGVEGRLEFLRKFIWFGAATLPLDCRFILPDWREGGLGWNKQKRHKHFSSPTGPRGVPTYRGRNKQKHYNTFSLPTGGPGWSFRCLDSEMISPTDIFGFLLCFCGFHCGIVIFLFHIHHIVSCQKVVETYCKDMINSPVLETAWENAQFSSHTVFR